MKELNSKRVLVPIEVLEDLMKGKKVKRDFKLKYGRYCLKDLERVLKRRGLTVGREGEGKAEE